MLTSKLSKLKHLTKQLNMDETLNLDDWKIVIELGQSVKTHVIPVEKWEAKKDYNATYISISYPKSKALDIIRNQTQI